MFAPDLSMLAYLANARVGSLIYNLAHNYALPALLVAVALLAGKALGVQLALIWLTHISLDRMLGYGLKYPTEFKNTP